MGDGGKPGVNLGDPPKGGAGIGGGLSGLSSLAPLPNTGGRVDIVDQVLKGNGKSDVEMKQKKK